MSDDSAGKRVGRGRAPVRLFDPGEAAELLRGWQLHVSRRRTIHEMTARRLERYSQWLTVPTTLLATVAGTSAFAAGQADSGNQAFAIFGLVIGIGAGVGSHLRSTLNLSTRAEANRRTASGYKALLRDFELLSPAVGALPMPGEDSPLAKAIEDLKAKISAVDAEAPVVPHRLAAREEARPVVVVTQATGLVR